LRHVIPQKSCRITPEKVLRRNGRDAANAYKSIGYAICCGTAVSVELSALSFAPSGACMARATPQLGTKH
jgi:hypothetical protein